MKGKREQDEISCNLTPRERTILELVAQGFTPKEIAAQLYISPETVKKHVKNTYSKLGACNKIGALRKAGLFCTVFQRIQ